MNGFGWRTDGQWNSFSVGSYDNKEWLIDLVDNKNSILIGLLESCNLV